MAAGGLFDPVLPNYLMQPIHSLVPLIWCGIPIWRALFGPIYQVYYLFLCGPCELCGAGASLPDDAARGPHYVWMQLTHRWYRSCRHDTDNDAARPWRCPFLAMNKYLPLNEGPDQEL